MASVSRTVPDQNLLAVAPPPCDCEAEISRYRGILADAPSHNDEDLRAACEALLEMSKDHDDRTRAKELLEVLT
jgi:hypothetical protein